MFYEDDDIGADWKPLDNGASGREVIETVNRIQAAVRSGAGSSEAALSRMAAELSAKVEEAKRVGVEAVPRGSDADMDRFVRADGSVVLGSGEEKRPAIDYRGQVVTHAVKVRGLLTTDTPLSARHNDLLRAYQGWVMARKLASRAPGDYAELALRASAEFFALARSMPGRVGAYFRALVDDPAMLARALNGSAGNGADFFGTPVTGSIIRPADIGRALSGRIRHQSAASGTFSTPAVSGRVVVRKRGVTSDEPADLPKATVTTSAQSTTITSLSGQVLLDSMLAKRSGNPYDIVELVRSMVSAGFADALELMFLHGDTAGTHQDAVATWTVGGYFSAGALSGTDASVAQMLGARAHAADVSAVVAGAGAFSAAGHVAALALLGTRFAEAEMAVGIKTFLTMLGLPEFTTRDKAGEDSTLFGASYLGRIGPVPLHLSQFLPSEFATSGLYTGSGSTGVAVYFAPSAWSWYHEESADETWDVSHPEKGAQYVGATKNLALARTIPSTDTAAAVLANIG